MDGFDISIDYLVLNYKVSCFLDTSVGQETVQKERTFDLHFLMDEALVYVTDI